MSDTFTLTLPKDTELADILADTEPCVAATCSNRNEKGELHAPENWLGYAKKLKAQPLENITIIDLANALSVVHTGKILDGYSHYKEYATKLKADI